MKKAYNTPQIEILSFDAQLMATSVDEVPVKPGGSGSLDTKEKRNDWENIWN
ncbi:MAG: hypothetical protein IKM65_06925 [Bacteroidaceae bacterium]|nr:hypothetical protein [Bacteroidaceae bacterium]